MTPEQIEAEVKRGQVVAAVADQIVRGAAVQVAAAKRAADTAHGGAIDAQAEADARFGHGSEEAWDANERSEAACWEAHLVDWKFARTPPTTLAGVAAALRFANQIEDEGLEWPGTDTIGAEGWHYQLRANLATSIEAIIRKAVRS